MIIIKKNILYLSHVGDFGGAEISLYNLMINLDRRKYRPIFACGNEGPLVNKTKEKDIPTYIIPMPTLRGKNIFKTIVNIITFIVKLNNIKNKENIDVIHTNTYRSRIYGIIFSFLSKVKIISHIRDINNLGLIENILTFFGDKVIVISEKVEINIKKQISKFLYSKIIKIYNGVDIDQFNKENVKDGKLKKEYNIKENDIIIGIVGRLADWKRQDVFIKAANILKKEEKLKFIIVGDALLKHNKIYKNKLEKMVKEFDLEEKVIFTGFRDDVQDIMSEFDIFVLTSDNEPFGRVLIEAMALELPIIATNSGGVPEIIKDGENGILIPVDDEESLVNAINYLLKSNNLKSTMGKNNRERVEDLFSIKSNVKYTQKLYDEL